MKKTHKYSIALLMLIMLLNFALPHSEFLLNRSINNQIEYLSEAFENGLSEELRNRYPEGELFGNLIFALSLIEYLNENGNVNIDLIETSIQRCLSSSAKENFNANLSIEYGAFYNGWINYTLKKYLECEHTKSRPLRAQFEAEHTEMTSKIIKAQKDSVQLFETYSKAIWPGDNFACIASLGTENSELQKQWIKKLEQESNDILIHHYGGDPEIIRGSSQALVNYFFFEVDNLSGRPKYETFLERFENNILGIQFIKEFENGNPESDIDSGPIVFEIGSVATIINNKVQSSSYYNSGKNTFGFLNTCGISINLFGKKFYLFKQEPIFDIFMLWCSVGHLAK